MSFEKVVDARVWGVTVQDTDIRMTAGDSSANVFTARANPLRGTLFWDRCMYVLHNVTVAGTDDGGSYTVTVETDAIVGYTGLPIAEASGIGGDSPATIILDNLHQSASSPLPTHLHINETATGAGITLTCDVIAKQYRGVLGTPGSNTSERILQGTMLKGNSQGFEVGDDAGISVDVTFAVDGASASSLGMSRMRLWDNAMFWAVAGVSAAGTHDVDIIGEASGTTFSIASTGTGAITATAGIKVPVVNKFYGQCPNPTAIIWTEVTSGGVSDARVVMIAKGGRGSAAKR